MSEIILNAANFDKVVMNGDEPILVDFYADWCGPCQMMAPIISELAQEVSGVKITKLNVDEAPAIAERYNIMSIPAFKIFKNGKVVDEMNGALPKDLIKDKLENAKK